MTRVPARLLFLLLLAAAAPVLAAGRLAAASDSETADVVQPDTDLIDEPTAAVLDYGSYSGRARFFSGGGLLGAVEFGVFQQINIGASLNVNALVGSGSPVQAAPPGLQAKWRYYDGSNVFPALAAGYDGQGYYYDTHTKEYSEKGHGFYLVGSKEIGARGLSVNFGANVPDLNSGIAGFLGAEWNFLDKAALIAEWDNIRNVTDSRFNGGLRVYASPSLQIDFDVREIGRAGQFEGSHIYPERVVQLKYTGNF